jgi:hypothetical protein
MLLTDNLAQSLGTQAFSKRLMGMVGGMCHCKEECWRPEFNPATTPRQV